jgi:hypothetical protein
MNELSMFKNKNNFRIVVAIFFVFFVYAPKVFTASELAGRQRIHELEESIESDVGDELQDLGLSPRDYFKFIKREYTDEIQETEFARLFFAGIQNSAKNKPKITEMLRSRCILIVNPQTLSKPKTYVKPVPDVGVGLFAEEDISPGTLLGIYSGKFRLMPSSKGEVVDETLMAIDIYHGVACEDLPRHLRPLTLVEEEACARCGKNKLEYYASHRFYELYTTNSPYATLHYKLAELFPSVPAVQTLEQNFNRFAVDAAEAGNELSLMNHSEEFANVIFEPVLVIIQAGATDNYYYDGEPKRIAYESLLLPAMACRTTRLVPRGKQLLIHYGDGYWKARGLKPKEMGSE